MAVVKWTMEHIQKLKEQGKIRGFTVIEKPDSGIKNRKSVQDKPLALQKMKEVLQKHGLVYETEYRFHKVRKFRFDLAIPELKLAFEYEGVMSAKSRHTSVTGYTRDATKYNLAQSEGWRVFRYTVLNHTEIENDLIKILNK